MPTLRLLRDTLESQGKTLVVGVLQKKEQLLCFPIRQRSSSGLLHAYRVLGNRKIDIVTRCCRLRFAKMIGIKTSFQR